MQRHMKVKAALAALAITGGAAVAAIGPASPALGFFSPPLLLEIHVNCHRPCQPRLGVLLAPAPA